MSSSSPPATPAKGPMKVCVFGSGSFGTAMAFTVAKAHVDYSVVILCRDPAVAAGINDEHANPKYVKGYALPDNITATIDAAQAIEGASFIVHAIPAQASMAFLADLKDLIPTDVPIVNTSKGLHAEKLTMMSEIIPLALGRDQPTAFISGPSFAKELLQEFPSAVVVASTNDDLAVRVQHLFSSHFLRIYTSSDVVGVELAGALKNVYAIGCGIIEGLGYQLNTTAALVTRAVSELNKLTLAKGGRSSTLAGLSGVGDLMLTCFGSASRNRTLGKRLGSGETLEKIIATSNEVAEGLYTAPAACKLAQQLGLELPIMNGVNAVLQGELTAEELATHLMSLPLRPED